MLHNDCMHHKLLAELERQAKLIDELEARLSEARQRGVELMAQLDGSFGGFAKLFGDESSSGKRRGGSRRGWKMSAEAKARIGAATKLRWERKKQGKEWKATTGRRLSG